MILKVKNENGQFKEVVLKGLKGDKGDRGEDGTVLQQKEIDDIKSSLDNKATKTLINVKDFGVKGDGITDDTLLIQDIFNRYNNIYFPEGEYIVSKNMNLERTDNSQPCLEIKDKDFFSLSGDNAKLVVKEHGQGILEIIKCKNVNIANIELIGHGYFPEIQSNGTGEKGYFDVDFTWGKLRNNNTNTIGLTNIDKGFGGGYIGSAGIGLLIYDNSNNIKINNCNIHGFNFSGISVGDHYLIGNVKDVKVTNNTIYNCYDNGINLINCENVDVTSNIIHNIGHPNADINMENTNPGYGIASRKVVQTRAKASNTINISNNIIYECVRKGIDSHSGYNFNIFNNLVTNCWFSGIAFLVPSQYANICCNTVKNCGYKESGITLRGDSTISGDLFALVANNIIEKCGGATENKSAIDIAYANYVDVLGNNISGMNDNADKSTLITVGYANFINIKNNMGVISDYLRCIYISDTTTNVNVENNTIRASKYYNKYINYLAKTGNVLNNYIYYDGTDIPSGHAINIADEHIGVIGGNIAINSNNEYLTIRYPSKNSNQIPILDTSSSPYKLKYIKGATIYEYILS